MPYEVVGKRVILSRTRTDGEEDDVLEVGDVVEPPESALEGFPDRFREVPGSDESDDDSEDEEGN